VVHGGIFFTEITQINKSVLEKIKELSDLAPLHNPPAIALIEYIQQKSQKTIWACFDTAFHQTIPHYISHYPLPSEITNPIHLQKYGFHGIAIQSLLRKISTNQSIKNKKIIFCHLGGGCSITAVNNGKSVNNSMGFTPLEGAMMVNRSGTINAGAFAYLKEKLNMNDEECLDFLNHNAGLEGYTGESDIKKIFEIASENPQSKEFQAIEIFTHRICEYIWNYYGLLNGVDMIVFSGGIGRKNAYARQKICEKLSVLGIQINNQKNKNIDINISTDIADIKSEVSILVMKTNEAEEIAMQIVETI